MMRYVCGMVMATLLFVDVQFGWSQQQYLYSPAAVAAEGTTQSKDGILVQEVEVQRGDTLYRISRRFSGYGSYYPQILLFNDIKDPNKIYPGNVFRVPVARNRMPRPVDKARSYGDRTGHGVTTQQSVVAAPSGKKTIGQCITTVTTQQSVVAAPSGAPVAEVSTPDLKKADNTKDKKRAGKANKPVTTKKQSAGLAADATAGQKLFEQAVKAYRRDDCRAALESFDRFLAKNQSSPLAADASLYKADCYLRLSNQK